MLIRAPGPGKARLARSLMIGWSGIIVRFHGRLASHAGVCWSKTAWHGMAWHGFLSLPWSMDWLSWEENGGWYCFIYRSVGISYPSRLRLHVG